MSIDSAPAVPPSASRVRSLDIFRGIAVLMVVIHHANEVLAPGQPLVTGALGFLSWKIRHLGFSGVGLFFVLSGFLIGGLLFSEIETRGRLQIVRFWIRRGFKIWPSYFVLLIVLAFCAKPSWLNTESTGDAIQSLAVHGFFLQNYLDQKVNGPTWSLAVEEHFYLLLPLLLTWFIMRREKPIVPGNRVLWLVGGFVVAGFALRSTHAFSRGETHPFDFMLTHFRMDSLMLGVGLQFYYRTHKEAVGTFMQKHRWLVAGIGLVLITPQAFLSERHPVMFSVGFLSESIGYALLLLWGVTNGFGRFENSWAGAAIAKTGTWSYNIYLWHYFLPSFWIIWVWYEPTQLWLAKLSLPAFMVLSLQIGLLCLVSIAIGFVMTKLIEEPFLKLRTKLCPSTFKPNVV